MTGALKYAENYKKAVADLFRDSFFLLICIYLCTDIVRTESIAETQHTPVLSGCDGGTHKVNETLQKESNSPAEHIQKYVIGTYRACIQGKLYYFKRNAR